MYNQFKIITKPCATKNVQGGLLYIPTKVHKDPLKEAVTKVLFLSAFFELVSLR